jgi:hypothetical protein
VMFQGVVYRWSEAKSAMQVRTAAQALSPFLSTFPLFHSNPDHFATSQKVYCVLVGTLLLCYESEKDSTTLCPRSAMEVLGTVLAISHAGTKTDYLYNNVYMVIIVIVKPVRGVTIISFGTRAGARKVDRATRRSYNNKRCCCFWDNPSSWCQKG